MMSETCTAVSVIGKMMPAINHPMADRLNLCR